MPHELGSIEFRLGCAACGNHMTHGFGECIVATSSRGMLRLPDRDGTVLQRWGARPYGL
jgi:hypothetical protein